ncbi:MAG: c-type cytochrome [Betaproteobacteria bacterium]|nr:c-type cytochrome [Betaproteobacteria bacterium]
MSRSAIRHTRISVGAFVSVLLFAAGTPAGWAQAPKSGEQVYKEVCTACHATGVSNAPKFGDKKAWARLIKEGQVTLTIDGWFGVRAMPPKGGNPNLALDEFARAVAFMAGAAGANWKDPDAALLDRLKAAEQKKLDKAKAKK